MACMMIGARGPSPAPSRIRLIQRAGSDAKRKTGSWATDQTIQRTRRIHFALTRLAIGAATNCATPKSMNTPLPSSPNCAGVMPKSSISGTATIPRMALSAQLIIISTSSITAIVHP